MVDCRVIIDAAGGGAWNMAVDEALLEAAADEGVAALRFYTWREPTLSLGYFQGHAQRAQHPASSSCPMVRRASGGGAILHDRELTYSIALPRGHRLGTKVELLYYAAHETLIDALRMLGVGAVMRPREAPAAQPGQEPFLCFQREAVGDVLVGAVKVAGSAQRRRRGAVLQHGSVILERSKFAPELPGIAELAGQEGNVDRLRELWQPLLVGRLGASIHTGPLPGRIGQAAERLTQSKFANPAWNLQR